MKSGEWNSDKGRISLYKRNTMQILNCSKGEAIAEWNDKLTDVIGKPERTKPLDQPFYMKFFYYGGILTA